MKKLFKYVDILKKQILTPLFRPHSEISQYILSAMYEILDIDKITYFFYSDAYFISIISVSACSPPY